MVILLNNDIIFDCYFSHILSKCRHRNDSFVKDIAFSIPDKVKECLSSHKSLNIEQYKILWNPFSSKSNTPNKFDKPFYIKIHEDLSNPKTLLKFLMICSLFPYYNAEDADEFNLYISYDLHRNLLSSLLSNKILDSKFLNKYHEIMSYTCNLLFLPEYPNTLNLITEYYNLLYSIE